MEAQEKPIVVVGVTESGSSRTALRLAAREADYRGATLIAIMAYGSNPVLGTPAARPLATSHNADDERLVAESALRDAVADALGEGQYVLRKAPCPVLVVPDADRRG